MRIFVIICLLLLGAESAIALTIDADKARIKTEGGAQYGLWNMWSNGMVGDFIEFKKPGKYVLTITAKGSPALDVWPNMVVANNGVIFGQTFVKSVGLSTFTFPFQAQTGVSFISIQLTNNISTEQEERNILLKHFKIEFVSGDSHPVLGNKTRWKQKEKLKEKKLLLEAEAAIDRLRKQDVTVRIINDEGDVHSGISLDITQTEHSFLFGGNIFAFDRLRTEKENEIYKSRFSEIFNYATTDFYWSSYEPEIGKPHYDYTDRVVEWCKEQNIRVKGHPILWEDRYGKPEWSDGTQPPPAILENRVNNLVTRYAGKIESWEVVNEPSHFPDLTVNQPYRWARRSDPTADLIINDYSILEDSRPQFYSTLEQAIDNEVPFDGIGIQAHEPITTRFSLESINSRLDLYATLGKPLHITEFTPTSAGLPVTGILAEGVWDEKMQADYAVGFYTICFAHPAVKAISWWDLSDQQAWQAGGGLLRKDLTPKPAYFALKNLIHTKWMTAMTGKTDSAGHFQFRGFTGDYSLKIKWKGTTIKRKFEVKEGESNNIKVVLTSRE